MGGFDGFVRRAVMFGGALIAVLRWGMGIGWVCLEMRDEGWGLSWGRGISRFANNVACGRI